MRAYIERTLEVASRDHVECTGGTGDFAVIFDMRPGRQIVLRNRSSFYEKLERGAPVSMGKLYGTDEVPPPPWSEATRRFDLLKQRQDRRPKR